jgi:hypothetical protein
LRPELRRTKDRAIPAKVRSGFASGIAQNKRQRKFQQKCTAVLRPELRRTKDSANSSKSAQRFCVQNCVKTKG